MTRPCWIWYPGDMELYYGLKQNMSRVERGYGWPAFWKSDGFRNRVVFRKDYELAAPTTFTVCSKAVGYVLADEKKYPFGRHISLPEGSHRISVHAMRIDAFPAIFVEGDVIFSDRTWTVSDYVTTWDHAGTSAYFTDGDRDVAEWPYSEALYKPISVKPASVSVPTAEAEDIQGNKAPFRISGESMTADGFLYEFETELTAELLIRSSDGAPLPAEALETVTAYLGESTEEALDPVHCYYSFTPDGKTGRTPRAAVRAVFIPGPRYDVTAIHQYVDIPVRVSFSGKDEKLKRIWEVAAHTFKLASGIFFIDGVKRDKWIWSGDAYQSIQLNPYLFRDPDIDRRTLIALRGNDPVTAHINTIADYSMLWLIGVMEHTKIYDDFDFLRDMYPKMKTMADFLMEQTDELGFFTGRPGDWIYIDWADMDKTGAFGAEQMLYALTMRRMGDAAALLGLSEDEEFFRGRWEELKENINSYYWDEEKGAYIDSFRSGRRYVTRQTNIFALRSGVCEGARRDAVIKNVLLNPDVPPITTPYFTFYELDELGKAGLTDILYERLTSYWGGMLDKGAVTFWEEYDPTVPDEAQYDMYGDRFGKSLCHAWAASPLYLIGRYLSDR